ncbi:MAG: hypothetical protein HOI00_01475 [Halieaceae bacterium]|nr:hypothetical protein [Halieaceae bacterium]
MTEPSMKMGKYIAILSPPTNTPSTDMIIGSMSELIAPTAAAGAMTWTCSTGDMPDQYLPEECK